MARIVPTSRIRRRRDDALAIAAILFFGSAAISFAAALAVVLTLS